MEGGETIGAIEQADMSVLAADKSVMGAGTAGWSAACAAANLVSGQTEQMVHSRSVKVLSGA